MQVPRKDRPCWQDEFMLQAIIASWRSPDPNTQVGAIVVDDKNCIVGTGYNGFPRGITPGTLPWDRDKKDPLDNKYAYVVHAEKNAVVNARGSIEGCTIFVTMFPCNECAKDLLQVGIKRIVYLTNPYEDSWSTQAAARMFEQLDIETIQHEWQNPEILSLYLDDLCKQIKQKLQ